MDPLIELGYPQPNAMADPRLPVSRAYDWMVLITMAGPVVADCPRTQLAAMAHDGWLQSDYVRATHWPAVHTANGLHFPIWGRIMFTR